jgi:hypothetical protein
MPYACVDDSKIPEMERCIEKVMAQGHDEDSAIGICCASIGGKELKMSQNSTQRAKQKASLRHKLKESQRKAEAERQALDDALAEDEPELEIVEKCGPEMAYVDPEPPYGGALTLAEAMMSMDSDRETGAMEFALDLFDAVKSNIRRDENVTDKGAAIAKAARELQALLANPTPLMKEAQIEKSEGDQEGEKEKDVAQARQHLEQAIELHQAHIEGDEPTDEASQEKLMGHIKAALEELPTEKQHGGEHGGHGGEHGEGGGEDKPEGGKRGAGSRAREEFDRINRRLAAGNLKRGERALLEKRAERAAREILEVEAEAGKEYGDGPEAIHAKSFIESISDAVSGVVMRFREGRRHSTKDQTNLQTIHDSAVDLGAECAGMTGKESSLEIFKDADGKLRWITYSSSAYQDKDKEIVSQKALAGAAEDMRRAKAYGPLRWWHVPGADFGPCDFSALHERILVETGTFADEEIGQSLKEHADELEVSIGFTHPKDQPDADGIFDKVNIFERSLLPKGKASNHLTAFNVKEVSVDKDKQAELEAKIGKDKAQAILDGAAAKRKEADEKDARYKAKAMSDMTEDDVAAMMTKALAPYLKEVKELKDALAAGKGEKDSQLTEAEAREKEHTERLKAIETGLTAALAGVAELKGEQPRAALHRPSQDGKIVGEANAQGQIVSVEERFKNVFPQADPLAKFMDALMPGSVAPGQQ